ncbi:MAG: cytochrome c [Paracoccaceae bacterium]
MLRLTTALALLLTAASPAQPGDATLGQALFVRNCIDCHGPTAEGDDTAPDIRGASRVMLDRALPGLDQMPEFDFSEHEIEALRAYLATLDG